jgi:hypothetical protein
VTNLLSEELDSMKETIQGRHKTSGMADACIVVGERHVECSDGDTRFGLGAAILGHHDRGKFT